VLPAEALPDLPEGDTGGAVGAEGAEGGEFRVVEEQVTALGTGRRNDQALAQVVVHVGAWQTGGGAEVAGQVQPPGRGGPGGRGSPVRRLGAGYRWCRVVRDRHRVGHRGRSSLAGGRVPDPATWARSGAGNGGVDRGSDGAGGALRACRSASA